MPHANTLLFCEPQVICFDAFALVIGVQYLHLLPTFHLPLGHVVVHWSLEDLAVLSVRNVPV